MLMRRRADTVSCRSLISQEQGPGAGTTMQKDRGTKGNSSRNRMEGDPEDEESLRANLTSNDS